MDNAPIDSAFINSAVTYHVDDNNIATVTLNRAEKHNAFNDDMIAELERLFKKAGSDDSVRALVLRAEGKSFGAGADLNWMKKMASYTEAQNHEDAMGLASMLHTLYTLPNPPLQEFKGLPMAAQLDLLPAATSP